jgi:predicted RNA-binding protein YlqC (UPF0109 family)
VAARQSKKKQYSFQVEIKSCGIDGSYTYFPRGVRVTELSERNDSAAVVEMISLLQTIARALVDDTTAVKVEAIPSPDSHVLRLHVSPQDIGKLIGKQGRTARSLRTILSAASMKLQSRFALDIVEAGRPEPITPTPQP